MGAASSQTLKPLMLCEDVKIKTIKIAPKHTLVVTYTLGTCDHYLEWRVQYGHKSRCKNAITSLFHWNCKLSVKMQFCFICGCFIEGTMYSGMYTCVGDCTLKMKAAYSSQIFVSINMMSLPQRPQNNYSPSPNPQGSYRFISWPFHFNVVVMNHLQNSICDCSYQIQ